MENYEKLKSLVLQLEDDVKKSFEKGNKAAGVRVRKQLQIIKAQSQILRKEISDNKNNE